MPIKCILFDSDGVVTNAEMFSLQYQKEFGVSNDEMLPFFRGEFQDCIVGKADLKEIITPWISKWGWQGSVESFVAYWFKVEHKVEDRVVDAIKKLKEQGIVCCLATNQEKYRTEYMKKEMGFEGLFNEIYSSAEIGFKKPDTKFYEYILKNLKNKYSINTDEIIFFDDTVENVKGACDVGIKAYLYTTFEGFEAIINDI